MQPHLKTGMNLSNGLPQHHSGFGIFQDGHSFSNQFYKGTQLM